MAHVALGARLAIAVATFTVAFFHVYMTCGTFAVIHKKCGKKMSDGIPSLIMMTPEREHSYGFPLV
jgi:hypothetical protein